MKYFKWMICFLPVVALLFIFGCSDGGKSTLQDTQSSAPLVEQPFGPAVEPPIVPPEGGEKTEGPTTTVIVPFKPIFKPERINAQRFPPPAAPPPAGVEQPAPLPGVHLGSADENYFIYGIAVSNDSYIYVVGSVGGYPIISKFNSQGMEQWSLKGGVQGTAKAVVLDDDTGNIYVSGDMITGDQKHTFLSAYKSDGTEYEGGVSYGPYWVEDHVNGMAISPNKKVYMVGYTLMSRDISGMADSKGFITQFSYVSSNMSGLKLHVDWVRFLETPFTDEITGVAVGNDGHIYAVGYFNAFEGRGRGGQDVLLRKYDANGDMIKTAIGTSTDEVASGVVVDSLSNDVYVTGWTKGDIGGSGSLVGEDVFLVKFDSSNLSVMWKKQEVFAGNERARGITMDPQNNLYIAADNEDPTETIGFFVLKYGSNGTRYWINSFGVNGRDKVSGIASDSSGNIYVTGTTKNASGISNGFLMKLDSKQGEVQ